MTNPKPLTAAAARRMVRDLSTDWDAVTDAWHSGMIRTRTDLDRRYAAVKARYPRIDEARLTKQLDDSARAARRQAKQQAAFG